jgi:hypothetical protein
MVHARIGGAVRAGDVMAELHLAADDPGAVARAAACFTVGEEPAPEPALILERLD